MPSQLEEMREQVARIGACAMPSDLEMTKEHAEGTAGRSWRPAGDSARSPCVSGSSGTASESGRRRRARRGDRREPTRRGLLSDAGRDIGQFGTLSAHGRESLWKFARYSGEMPKGVTLGGNIFPVT